MLSKSALCLALGAPMTVLLHGCGSDSTTTAAPTTTPSPTPSPPPSPPPSPGPSPTPGNSSTPAPGPAHSTTSAWPVTTWPAPAPPAPTPGPPTPWDPATAVAQLNAMYMDFDENNDDSRLGVTISLASQPSSFNANMFCRPLMHTECYGGEADCRVSAAIYNHKVIVENNKFSPAMTRGVGYVFNQNLVETHFGKCAYLWDGADFSNLNNGCGNLQPGNCNDTFSAFANLCQQSGEPHTCTHDDPEVQGRLCKCDQPWCDGGDYGSAPVPQQPSWNPCYYEMPGLVWDDPRETNHLRDSVKQRVALQGNNPDWTGAWNEVVIDGHLLIPSVRENPTNTILAFVCIPSVDGGACSKAARMRDEFHQSYHVTGPGVPVVAIDTSLDFTVSNGPFVVPQDTLAVV